MQVFTKLNHNANLSLALGFFDGVHLGHQEVIRSAVNFANENSLKSAVITFKNHPCCYFFGVSPQYILTEEDKIEKIAQLGVDFLYILDFDNYIATLSAQEYLENILIKYFAPKSISTGFNHFFGANKSGNVQFLRENQAVYNYNFFEIFPQKLDNEIISSTLIRKCIQQGDFEKANRMLGYNFSIKGVVREGQKLGRTIGFKTANIEYPSNLIQIPYGVFETRTNNRISITNFGIKPTVSNQSKPIVETHILDYDENLYGQPINIEFLKMLRCEQKFASLNELKHQISLDISQIKNNS